MHLNGSSKHGILVAAVTILLSVLVLQTEITMVTYLVAAPEVFDIGILFILKHVGTFALALLAAIASVLMTLGIIKKRHTFIVPWMALYSLATVLFTFTIWYDLFSRNRHQFDDILFNIILMGIAVIVLYPVYILYADIRVENAATTDDDDSNYRQNIQDNFDECFPKTIL